MPNNVITELEQADAPWLTAVLSSSGALTHGSVAAVAYAAGGGNWSANARLAVEYTAGAQGALPRHLFLKMVNADLEDEFFGPSEVAYYTRDYVDVADAPLVRCYDAVFSQRRLRYHVLLDDLTTTHTIARDKAPTRGYGLALAEGLATMHARWWGAERLAEAGAPIHTDAHIQRFVDIAAPGVDHILARFGAEMAPHWPQMMRTLFARHPQALFERCRDANGFTLIHGDVGDANVLVPREGDRPIYVIDRQPFDWSLTTWLGAYDLAYAMVLDWDVATRRALEMPVLRRYHERLQANGVTNYSWQRLVDDYRLSVAMGVYIATEYSRGGINERWIAVTMEMLWRALTACDDLNCGELW